MPIDSFEDLYNKVAENKPRLTPEQFAMDMRDKVKAGKLYNRIKSHPITVMTIPDDLQTFMVWYGNRIPEVKKWDINTPAAAIKRQLDVLVPRYYGKEPTGFKGNNPPYFHETINMFSEMEFIDGLQELLVKIEK